MPPFGDFLLRLWGALPCSRPLAPSKPSGEGPLAWAGDQHVKCMCPPTVSSQSHPSRWKGKPAAVTIWQTRVIYNARSMRMRTEMFGGRGFHCAFLWSSVLPSLPSGRLRQGPALFLRLPCSDRHVFQLCGFAGDVGDRAGWTRYSKDGRMTSDLGSLQPGVPFKVNSRQP